MTTLWSAIEVAELTGKTAQKAPPRDPERKPGKGGRGKGDKGGKGKSREKKNQPCWLYNNGKCKYGDECIFKHEDNESKGAPVRQVLLDELVYSSTEVTTPMTMQGQVEEGWSLVQPKQTYRKAIRRLARVLESTGGKYKQHAKSKKLAWKKKNDTIFRVLEDSVGCDTGCGVTSDGDEQHIKSENFARSKSTTGWGTSCRCIDLLQMGIRGRLETGMCDRDGVFSSLKNSTRGADQQGLSDICRRGSDLVQPKGED